MFNTLRLEIPVQGVPKNVLLCKLEQLKKHLIYMKNKDHYIFIISQLWLTSHPRSTVVLLDIGTPSTSREIYSEDADGETRTRNPSVINRVL